MKSHVVHRCIQCHKLLRNVNRTNSSSTWNRLSSTEKFVKPQEDRIFSGIQPTGVPHLGNYVGAIQNWVNLQHQYNSVLISIVDLHSISIPRDPAILRQNILEMAACLIACGIDPNHTILFQQSMVPEHTYLAWVLGCLCLLPWLNLPQWKEKSQKVKDPGLGLYTYPVLQAADILLYKSTIVPVGEDQVIHLELTRNLARTFNRNFGTFFPDCKPLVGDQTKLRSLRNPTAKMSKSEENPLGRIDLNDGPDIVTEKIKKAVTDSEKLLTYNKEDRPGLANLFDIHASLTGMKQEELIRKHSDLNKVQYKALLAKVVNEHVQPIRDEMTKLLDDKHELLKILHRGNEKASDIARETVREVQELVGFR